MNGGDVESLSSNRCLSILRHHAFGSRSETASHIALRCLSNIILLSTSAKQNFIDQGYPELAVQLLQVIYPPQTDNIDTSIHLTVSCSFFPSRVTTLRINFSRLGCFFSVHQSLRVSILMSLWWQKSLMPWVLFDSDQSFISFPYCRANDLLL